MTKSAKKSGSNQLRIIAGRWRGSKIRFANGAGLRPTADRTRETLFNWLSADVPGASCLDLFAGSGILSFEALSRGAAVATALDTHREALQCMQREKEKLGADGLTLIQANALEWLQRATANAGQYDLVFLDPPFAGNLLQQAINGLDDAQLLKQGSLVYLEMPQSQAELSPPARWTLQREKSAGEVNYRLYRVAGD